MSRLSPVRPALRRLLGTALGAAIAVSATAVPTSATAAPAAAAPAGASTATSAPQSASRPTDPIAHDPTMAREGGYYYVIITGDAGRPNTYLPIKRSRDLVHWDELGPVFTALPAWVSQQLGVTPADAWAPDLTRVNGEWRLYYAVSQFGTQNSVIGLATTPTLDPASPAYRWTDRGMVIRSTPGVEDYNAIDPAYVSDGAGGAWLAFGSFWGGIRMRRLDPATGELSTTDTTVYPLASRVAPDAEEGASIAWHGGYYYLLLSFDFCCRGVESDYRMVVGRSRSVTGPYLDRDGVPLTNGGGTEVLRGYNEFIGTGGGSFYASESGAYLVNHYYDATDGGAPRLNVRPVQWSQGWPVVGDPLNPSRQVGHGDAYVRLIERTTGRPVIDVGCGYEGADVALGVDTPGDGCQQWQYGYRGNPAGRTGTSSLLNRFSNKIIEVAACVNVDGGRTQEWGWIGFLPNNDCQRWQAEPTTDGWTRIRTILPGARVLDVARCAGGTTDNVVINQRSDASCQQFRLAPVGPVLLIDEDTTSTALGGPGCPPGGVIADTSSSTVECRQWRFTSAGGAEYTITDARTGHPLAVGAFTHWTLVPRTDGAWNLALVGTTVAHVVKVLIP
ncbi:MAG: family 43 glycosylhydrolase [Micromonosporaceae bacterium]|nr:family 43 glycosylhydrolase [Micromonosporaceae bacterium]